MSAVRPRYAGDAPPVTHRAPTVYRPRRPERTVVYQVLQQHLETWLAQVRIAELDDDPVPPFVERDFRQYLGCGILAYGFARAVARSAGTMS
jgi:hypothetical protein